MGAESLLSDIAGRITGDRDRAVSRVLYGEAFEHT